ncbi:MAG TPA: hypothetical protein VNW92_12890 [Polyangiaceae bacterium]|jgi:hypothetical protein|nr:hypothetical protein [Polyangiaceae bacterium]
MLVMLAPTFDGSAESYARLARATGMVAYDLKSRVKPGLWGIVRVLADEGQAAELARRLQGDGFPVFVVPREVAHDTNRRIVTIRALEVRETELVLHLREREMPIAFGALTCVVRGEVHLGQVPARSMTPTSSTFRAVVPSTSDVQMFRESLSASNFEAFAAADLHFATVLWAARIDARSFDFSLLGERSESPALDLDRLVDEIAKRAGVRVDRGVRASSVVSVLMQVPPGQRSITPPGGHSQPPRSQASRARETPSDERFDPYSRVIAEAERLFAQTHKPA